MHSCSIAKSLLIVVFIIGILFCEFAQMITFGVWLGRINPYFKYGDGLGAEVYGYVKENVFSSLAILLAVIGSTFFNLCCRNESCTTSIINSIYIIIAVIFGLHTINAFFGNFSFISQFKAGLIALDNGYYESGKCYQYLKEGLKGADAHYGTDSGYLSWKKKFMQKAFDKYSNPTSYACKSVGSPAFAFALVTTLSIAGIVVLSLFICFPCCCRSRSDDTILDELL